MTTNLTIVVQNTDKCITLLKFIDKNMPKIRMLDVRLTIKKICEEDNQTIGSLAKNGITNLPTLITPEGKLYVGVREIIKLINSNIKTLEKIPKPQESTDDVRSFLMRQMYDVVDGSMVPRKDPDGEDDEAADFEKKLKAAKMPTPKASAARTENYKEYNNSERNKYEQHTDNIAVLDSPAPLSKQSCLDAITDEADKRMMSAWLDNIPSEY